MKEDMVAIISHTLLELGIPSNYLGFSYLVFAITLILDRPHHNFRASKELYITVGEHFGTSYGSVERCMRYAILTGWALGNKELINKIFLNSLNPKKTTPTNSQYISSLCLYLCSLQTQQA